MWPREAVSDFNVQEVSTENLSGRRDILIDVRADSQGMAGAYGLLAVAVPLLVVAGLFFGWFENESRALLIGGLLFVIGVTASTYGFIWFRWADKRLRRVDALLEERGER